MSDEQLALDVPTGRKGTKRTRGGAVYQGTSATIRWLEDQGTVDKQRHAGLAAQARSLAASIDRESGDDVTRKQASGVSLSALHAQLAAILQLLDPAESAAPSTGALGVLVDRWAAEDAEAQARARAQGTP
jgi:hypothetical protein